MRPGLLILSGYNLRAVIALCRRATAAAIPFHVIAQNDRDPILLTGYRTRVFETRVSAQLDLATVVEWIRRLRSAHGYSSIVLAPSTEFFNRFALLHRRAIEEAGGIVPLVSERLYAQISDKQSFADLCASQGIEVPAVFDQLTPGVPCVAKPKAYGAATSGQIKPYLVHTPDDLQHFVEREDPSRFFFQEFVDGHSLYLLAHLARNGAVTMCAQENLVQQSQGGSIILARAHDFHQHQDAQPYLQLLATVGFHGLIMIEVRRCARTGRHVMIEANPRMWGPLQFTLDQGVDIVGAWLADYGFPVTPLAATPTRAHYLWSGGLAGQPVSCAFHNYSAERFAHDYPTLAKDDVFRRPDTQRLYEHEQANAA